MINRNNNQAIIQIISKTIPAKEFGQLRVQSLLIRMENKLRKVKKTKYKVMMQEKRRTTLRSQFL
jgi:hypothetical protein